MKLAYDNITISGKVAVGKNTLLNNLERYLKPLGWHFRSQGQIVRDYLKEYILPNASKAPEKLHREIDDRVHELLTEEKSWVIEAWLAGFLARDLPNVLRVLLVCDNEPEQIDRVSQRDHVSAEEAREFIETREEDNLKEFQRLYGKFNFWDPKYYQLVIDTKKTSKEETTGQVLKALRYKHVTIKAHD